LKNQRLDYDLLSETLRDRQLVAVDPLNHILHQVQSTGVLLPGLLVKEGLISDYELARVACEIFALPFFPVDLYQPDKDLLAQFDPDFLRHYSLVPLDRRGKLVVVAMPGMVPAEVLLQAEASLQAKIVPVVGTVGGNSRWLEEHLPPPQAINIGSEAESGAWAAVLDMGEEAVQTGLDQPQDGFDLQAQELEANLELLNVDESDDRNSLRRSPSIETLDFELPDLGMLDDPTENAA
jgi:Type II secretion system (T2SS), protein E, N-terminal domain